MHSIQQQLDALNAQIDRAAREAGRSGDAVTLLAVSKTRNLAEIRAVADCGITQFGENYLQEALPKITQLADAGLCWHFIGAVQSNKTRDICKNFHWLHTLDRVKIARRLSAQRLEISPEQPLNVCIQVNIDREPQKAGIAPEDLIDFLAEVTAFDGIRLRGLMAIPRPAAETDVSRQAFHALFLLWQKAATVAGPHWDTLSMGMSADFTEAILEGATIIRVGTRIFGPRALSTR